MILAKGEYKFEFDWQPLSESGAEIEVFFNHVVIGSFKASNNEKHHEVVHATACDCCEGENILKFVCAG